jgi:hypothetical protein
MTTSQLAKTRIRAATADLAVARSGIERDLAPLRAAFNRRRMVWIVAGGFAGGMALALLPRRLWAGIGAMAGSGAALVARSMLTPMIAGALMARKQPPAEVVVQKSVPAE